MRRYCLFALVGGVLLAMMAASSQEAARGFGEQLIVLVIPIAANISGEGRPA
jgi:hypothetical protein